MSDGSPRPEPIQQNFRSSRIEWIDAARAAGIFLVILGHIQVKTYGFFSPGNFISAFHMPLFFFLAGLTHKSAGIKAAFAKGARSLLLPYAVFYLLLWAEWFVVACLRHPELYPRGILFTEGFLKPFFGMLMGVGYDTTVSKMMCVPLWFCVSLFFCKLLHEAAGAGKSARVILCALLLFGAFLLQLFGMPEEAEKTVFAGTKYEAVTAYKTRWIPLSLGTLTLAYPFFCAGFLLKDRLFRNADARTDAKALRRIRGKKLFASAALFALVLAVSVFNQRPGVNSIRHGADLYVFLLGAAAGIGGIYFLCSAFPRVPKDGDTPRRLADCAAAAGKPPRRIFWGGLIPFIGRNSIVVLAFHSFATSGILGIAKRLFRLERIATEEMPLGLAAAVLVSALSCLCCCVPAFVIERRFPQILGRLNGGRK